MAKISVIMPAYNVAPYIGAAIASVRAQTVSDWELLVAEDGSTDHTAEIVRSCAASDPRVRLLPQSNRGCAAARNLAIRASTGEFLALLDGDDLWEPSFLAEQLAIFQESLDVDVVTGNARLLGGPHHGRPWGPWPDPRPHPTLTSILADEAAIFIMSVMRRRVYEAIGGFDEALRTGEDYEFWVRAAAAGFTFRRNDRPLGHYRRRGDSLSASDVRMLRGALTVYGKVRTMVAGHAEHDRIVEAQIERLQRDCLTAEIAAALGLRRWAVTRGLLQICGPNSVPRVAAATFIGWLAPRLLRRPRRPRRSGRGRVVNLLRRAVRPVLRALRRSDLPARRSIG